MTGNQDSHDLPRPAAWGLLVALVLLGAVLRFINLDSGLWYDEIKTLLESVRDPLGEIVTRFPGNNDHMLLSVLARISIVALGEHAWTMRLPAVLFGVAAIPMLYVFGKSITSRLEAILAALLLTVSYHHIWFSQNARGYTALLFCVLLATHLLVVGLEREQRWAFVGYGFAAALGAYAHLTMVLVVLTHAVIVLVRGLVLAGGKLRPREWLDPTIAFGLAGLLTVFLYSPVLLEVEAFFTADPQPKSARVATAGWAFWAMLDGLRVGFAMGWGLLFGAALFAVGCLSYLRQSPTIGALLLLPGPTTLAIAILLERPTFPRFFFFVAGFALLIAVRGASAIGKALASVGPNRPAFARLGVVAPIVFTVLLTAMSLRSLPYGYRYPKQDYAGAADYVESRRGEREQVVVVGGGAAIPYQQYLDKPWPRLDDVASFDTALARTGEMWLLFTFQSYIESREPELFAAIQEHCRAEESFHGTVAGGDVAIYRCGRS